MRVSTVSFGRVPADPITFWRALHPHPRHGFFLGAADGKDDLYLSAGEPARLVSLSSEASLAVFRRTLGRRSSGPPLPRFVGCLSFDAGRLFDPALARLPKQRDEIHMPPFLLGDYRAVVKVDFRRKRTTLTFERSSAKGKALTEQVRELLWHGVGAGLRPVPIISNKCRDSTGIKIFVERCRARPYDSFRVPSKKKFFPMVAAAKQSISRGDIYQANVSLRFTTPFRGDPVDLYRRLSRANPSPYACLLKQAGRWIVSCSPELLVSVEGGRVTTRPIAGTRPRGRTRELDQRRKGQLLLSPKERAEHIMLVDLERNDLGRVCAPGSVRVGERFSVERYSHVMHIVSQVQGRLAHGKTPLDALAAVFPGGTITGCPKIKSIEIIEALERSARGPFYGSAGYFCWNGDAKFNILIRTALVARGRATLQAGAGIVADSRPEREYAEVLAKAAALVEAVAGMDRNK